MKGTMFKKAMIFGGSGGLGGAILEYAPAHFKDLELHESSRRSKAHPLDLTKVDDQLKAAGLLQSQGFDLVIYCSGGGPFGDFTSKEWKDHHWALQLNLVAPALLIYHWLVSRKEAKSDGKFVVVGSRIAEQNPDPLASSYAAGKAGLYGLVSSLQTELQENKSKVWLFSPGYMDTKMLPLNAKVRHDGSKLMSPETAAQALLRWLKKDGPWHRVLN